MNRQEKPLLPLPRDFLDDSGFDLKLVPHNGPEEQKRLAGQLGHEYRAFVTDIDGTIHLNNVAGVIYRRVAYEGVVFATATGRDFAEHSRDITELRRALRALHEGDISPDKLSWPEVECRLLFGCIHGSRVYGGSYQPIKLEANSRADFTHDMLTLKFGAKEFVRQSSAWSILEAAAQNERVIISSEGSGKKLVDFALDLEVELRDVIRRNRNYSVLGWVGHPEELLGLVVVTNGRLAIALQPELIQTHDLPPWATVDFLQSCLNKCGLSEAKPRLNSPSCLAASWGAGGREFDFSYSGSLMDSIDFDPDEIERAIAESQSMDDTVSLPSLDSGPDYDGFLAAVDTAQSSSKYRQQPKMRTGQEVTAILNRHFEANGIPLAAVAGHLNVDILCKDANKMRVVEAVQRCVNLLHGKDICQLEDIARAGDAGIPGGNDYPMLIGRGGFSVDRAADGIPVIEDDKGPLRMQGGAHLLKTLKFSGVRSG